MQPFISPSLPSPRVSCPHTTAGHAALPHFCPLSWASTSAIARIHLLISFSPQRERCSQDHWSDLLCPLTHFHHAGHSSFYGLLGRARLSLALDAVSKVKSEDGVYGLVLTCAFPLPPSESNPFALLSPSRMLISFICCNLVFSKCKQGIQEVPRPVNMA